MVVKSTASEKRAFTNALKDARIGLPEAQYSVGLMYANGTGTPQDFEQASFWMEKAAEKGIVAAQYVLGTKYAGGAHATGIGQTRDAHKAFVWLGKAASLGHVRAMYKLGRLYAGKDGHGSYDGLASVAAHWFKAAAEQGLAEAQCAWGRALLHGQGIAPDATQAAQWLRRAADQGLGHAQYTLGQLCAQGIGVAHDPQAAMGWWRKAARQYVAAALVAMERMDASNLKTTRKTGRQPRPAPKAPKGGERRRDPAGWALAVEHGDADAAYHLGLMYDQGWAVPQDKEEARHWFTQAALSGDARAQLALGQWLVQTQQPEAVHWLTQATQHTAHADIQTEAHYALGRHFNPKESQSDHVDLLASLSHYTQAARGGHAAAVVALGHLLASSATQLTAQCFEKAAETGDPEAQFNWAHLLSKGQGTAKDATRAFSGFEAAAHQGLVAAQSRLGLLYAMGEGVAADPIEAHKWFLLAGAQRDKPALANLKRSLALLSPDQKASAEQRADAFMPRKWLPR